MVIKHSTAEEVTRLVADVVGEDHVRREAATARLSVIGGRAVDRVLASLADAPTAAGRAALLQVLERIGEPRALPVAEAELDSQEPGVAAAATGVLRSLLNAPRSDVATRALELITGLVLDRARPDAVRTAALDALHDLSPEVVAPLVEQLRQDPSAAVRRLAGFPARSSDPPDTTGGGMPAGPLTLEAMAEGALPPEPEVVKTAVLESAGAVPLPLLHRLVVAVRTREEHGGTERAAWTAVRGALHQALASRGSRVALYDLRETLEAWPDRVSVGMVAALAAIGDRSCLEPLAAAIAHVQDDWLRGQLRDAFHRIRSRERLTRRHVVMKRLDARYPRLLK